MKKRTLGWRVRLTDENGEKFYAEPGGPTLAGFSWVEPSKSELLNECMARDVIHRVRTFRGVRMTGGRYWRPWTWKGSDVKLVRVVKGGAR